MTACVNELSSSTDVVSGSDDDDDDDSLRFTSSTYRVTIPESTPVGATVLQVRAVSRRHLDDVITYALSNGSAIANMFAIDAVTGELSLRGHLVPRRSTVARLTVTATADSLPVRADVIVQMGGDPPTPVIVIGGRSSCDGCRHAAATVDEDAPAGTIVAFVVVADRMVTCSTMTSWSFELRRAADDAATYRLLTTSMVDRERQSAYRLQVDCRRSTITTTTTSSTFSSTFFIDVTINDINDNRPEVVTDQPVEVTIDNLHSFG